jgi:hypothetical protein
MSRARATKLGAPREGPGRRPQGGRRALVACQPSGRAEAPGEGRRVKPDRAGLHEWNRATCGWTQSTG